MRLLRTAFGNRGIARLEAGWAAASLGAWTFSITLALYSYYEGGPGAVALSVAARMLPAALLGPVAERIVERWSRRAVLVGGALARFALLEAIALVVSAELPFALLLGLAALFEIAAGVQRTARAGLLASLARTPAELAAASAGRFVDYAGFLAGALAAGVLLATGGLDTAFAVAGLAFLAAAASAWRVGGDGSRGSLGRGVRVGRLPAAVRSVAAAADPWVRVRLGLFGASALVQSMLELLLVVAALDVLGLGDSGVGWLRAAFAGGALAGGAVAVTLLTRGRLATGLAIGLVLAGVPLALVPAWPATAPALLFLVLLGGGYALVEAALLVLTQRLAPAEDLARVSALEEVVYPLARAAGAGLAAWLVVGLGDDAALVVAGLVLPLLAAASIGSVRRAERRAPVADEAFRLLRGLPEFAVLPTATVENLALRAVPEEFAAGMPIGGGFHVITAGTVALDRGSVEPLGAGDCFGASALLCDGPPDPPPIALTAVSTLTLTRPEFMSRVTAPGTAPRSASSTQSRR